MKSVTKKRPGTRRGSGPPSAERTWKFQPISLVVAALALAGAGALLYPSVASWWSQWNQSRVITSGDEATSATDADRAAELARAREYNSLLSSGALLDVDSNVPTSEGTSGSDLDYWDLLNATGTGMMSRIQIPAINVDLPVYHGTSPKTLEQGAGHLEGTSLPVGGVGTHTVITAHRGLASATLFTHLDQVEIGDTFTIETFGEVLVYQVIERHVVDPSDRKTVLPRPGQDLATLVTCTPLGVNTHRILLTGERVFPTPPQAIAKAMAEPEIPGFPWWAVWSVGAVLLIAGYVWWAGYPPKRMRGAGRRG